jgi:hypothetical protein
LKVLIPLLSGQENNPEFLEKALDGAKQLVVLLPIDTNAMVGRFGFAATEIRQGNLLSEEIRKAAEERGIACSEITEWGDTLSKIDHIAQLEKANCIRLLKQDNHYFRELLKKLKEKSRKKIETISLPEPEKKK